MIPLFKVSMSEEAIARASEVLRSGYIGQGKVVEEFESELQQHLQNPNVLSLNSGTSALHLALYMLAKEYPGKEVVTAALTCTATNWPILLNGFKIKWADVDPKTLNIDLKDAESKLTENTPVLMVVHWGGYPVDQSELFKIKLRYFEKYNKPLTIIEDCAHAFGSRYDGIPIGAHGNTCCFSFQAIKHVTCVDGGALVFPIHERELYRRAKLLRWYGIDREGPRTDFRCELDISEYGFKFHMNDVCAAVGLGNLKGNLVPISAYHRANADYYRREFTLFPVPGLSLLQEDTRSDSAYWLFTILVERRADFMRMMEKKGIQVSRVHERNDKHSCVSEFKTELPALDEVSKYMVCIPVGWWVTAEDREYIVNSIRQGW